MAQSDAARRQTASKKKMRESLPKGVTTVTGSGKPGPYTVGGKKNARITVKQMEANRQAHESERAGHKMIRENPPKVSVRAWLGSKIGVRKEKTRQKKVREALRSAQGRRSGR